MKNLKVATYAEPTSLINAILFLVFGMILFTNPGGIVKFISYIAGAILIIIGITNLFDYYKTKKKLNIEQNAKLISGIILIILGLISILFASVIETTLRLIIGAWIIYSGVMRLIEALNFKTDKTSFIIRLVISILMVISGFYVVLKTNLVFSAIGLFIIFYSIMEIVGFIIYSKK